MKGKFLVILMVIIALMGCKTDSGTDHVCEITNHAIDDDLSCGHSAKVYGYVNLDGGDKIPVYRTKVVTDTQMAGVVAKVQTGYDGVAGGIRPKINQTNVTAIYITDDAYESYDVGTKIIKLPYGYSISEMTTALQDIANYDIVMLKSCIKLAFGKKTLTKIFILT